MRLPTLSVVAAIALLTLMPAQGARMAANPNPGVLPPQSHPLGKNYGDWAAAWVQFLFSASDLSTCGFDEAGKVAFVPASFGGTAEVSCTIPSGIAILLSPGGDLCPPTEEELAVCAAETFADVTDVEVVVDGQPLGDLTRYQVVTPPFTVGTDVFAAAGYFLLLAPLPVGSHTIVLRDVFAGGTTEAEAIVTVAVTPEGH